MIDMHKVKDEWVIFRYDDNDHDWLKNKKSEYWTWADWKSWLANAKRFRFEDAAAQTLVKLRLLSRKNVW